MGSPERPTAPSPEPDEPPLIPRGNPLRWRTGLLITGGGLALGLANLLAAYGPRTGVFVGAFAVAMVAFGLLWTLGSFHDETDAPAVPIRALAPGLLVTCVATLATFFALRLAVAGTLGPIAAGILMPVGFIAAVSGAGMTLTALGALSDDTPFYRREGLWLIAFATVVLLPALGSYSLTDPWETHYGEVSREILSRRDWISLWWVNEEWFWSKPILAFWMQALSMATLGVRYEPGAMLASAADGSVPWPEWAVRFPFFLITVFATYVLYKAVARAFGRRAGLLSGVVLTTMPQWFFISHQTMTDMPFVAFMAAALGFFLLGAHEPGDRRVTPRAVVMGPLRLSLSGHNLLLFAICVLVIPQILYLATRNFSLNVDPIHGLRVPPILPTEDIFVAGSAGNCGVMPGNDPCVRTFAVYPKIRPVLQAASWALALALVLYLEWGERRTRRLYFLAAFTCAALSTMGKGPAGVVLPSLAVLGYLVATRRYRLLLDLEIAAGIATFCAVAMPWFAAMFVRHGHGFVDRLIFHDMYKRAFGHAHDTNSGDDVGFRYYVWQLGYGTFPWVAWIPFALMRALDRTPEDDAEKERVDRYGTLALLLVWFITSFALFSYMQTKFHHYIFPVVPALALLVGIGVDHVLDLAKPGAGGREHERTMTRVAMLAGAALVLLVARDLALDRPDQPSNARLLHLFTYQYERAWPSHISFSSSLWAFAIAGAVALSAVAMERIRRYAVAGFAVIATGFAVWSLDVYFPTVAPHWGQRELVLEYVEEARSRPGLLVAYQMNWKGENFYTGNRIANFKETGETFRDWVSRARKEGHNTFYFILIPGRLRALETELGNTSSSSPRPKELVKLTTPEQNNKFVLVRASF